MAIAMDKKNLKSLLIETGVIQYGQFTLKSGAVSSIYIDLRKTISYPTLLRAMAQALWNAVIAAKPTVIPQLLCGVPYGAIPVTSCIAMEQVLPMLMCRKDPKSHGSKKKIEGVYQAGQSCLVIEDVMTTGSSLLETIQRLKEADLVVRDVVAFVDREAGGAQHLQAAGYHLHRVFTLGELQCEDSTSH